MSNMKLFLNRSFCLFMALQVLISSTGFATTEHWCAVKGKKTFLFTKPKTCCEVAKKQVATSSETSIKRTKCCEEQTVFHKLNANASQGNALHAEFSIPILNLFPVVLPSFSFENTCAVSLPFPHQHNPAPPLSGRQRLVFLQSFLI